MKIMAKSPIFDAVHETAADLHRLGFIDKRKMRQFDVLCAQRDHIPSGPSLKLLNLLDRKRLEALI